MRALAWLALVVLALAPACKAKDNTRIVVAVWSDISIPEKLDSIRIDVTGTKTRARSFPLTVGTKLPVELLDLVPLGANDETVTVKATGLFENDDVVSQTARVSFVPGQSQVLMVHLLAECKGAACSGDSTCAAGTTGACTHPITDFSLSPYVEGQSLSPPDASAPAVRPDAAADIADAPGGGSGGTGTDTGTGIGTGTGVGVISIWAEWPMPNNQVDVAAGAPNPASYTDNRNGTVTDNVTGLMWQQAVSATEHIWAETVAHCPTLTLAGHTDWRLPSIIELVSIVDLGQSDPSINGTYFPGTPAGWFWSSSLFVGSSSYAWYVSFSNGGSNGLSVSYSASVRCVRG